MTQEKTVMVNVFGDQAASLTGIEGGVNGEQYVLSKGTFVIGRDEGADLSLADEPGMSRVHAKIVAENDRYRIIDNQSRNGTLVNGRPVQSELLYDGDLIGVGTCVLRFAQRGVKRPPTTAPRVLAAASGAVPSAAPPASNWLAAVVGAVIMAVVVAAVLIGIFIGRDGQETPPALAPVPTAPTAIAPPVPSPPAATDTAAADAGGGAGTAVVAMEAAPAALVDAEQQPLRLRAGGKITSVSAKEGDVVLKGAVIAVVAGGAISASAIATRRASIAALESVADANKRAAAQLAIEKGELRRILASSATTTVTATEAGKLKGLNLSVGAVARSGQVVGFIITKPASVTVDVDAKVSSTLPAGTNCTLTRADGTTLRGTLVETVYGSGAVTLHIEPAGDATGVATALCAP
jgi:hypothetical protein